MSSSSSLSMDHLPPSEQLCYVHCNICDTVLAVFIILSVQYLSPLFASTFLDRLGFFLLFIIIMHFLDVLRLLASS